MYRPYLLPIEDVLPCDYILVATPLSSPFYHRIREFIDRGQALDFIDELSHLGRLSQSREFVRRMTYAWAVALSLNSGLSGVPATYAIDHFGSGECDA